MLHRKPKRQVFLGPFNLKGHLEVTGNCGSKDKFSPVHIVQVLESVIITPLMICALSPAGTWPSSTLWSSACRLRRPKWWWGWSGFWLCSWPSLSTTTPPRTSSPTGWCATSTGPNTKCATSKRCECLCGEKKQLFEKQSTSAVNYFLNCRRKLFIACRWASAQGKHGGFFVLCSD